MRRLAFALLGLAACGHHAKPTPEPAVDAAAPVAPLADAGLDAGADASDAADAGARPSLALHMVSRTGRDGAVCLVLDASGKTVGHATAHETAAGGSEVRCDRFEAQGKVILLSNSRGTFSKDARPGPRNDRTLPCGDGIFASDVSSCVQIDASPFSYSPEDPKDTDFTLSMCDLEKSRCATLVQIPQGLHRTFESPRPWGAAYCGDDRVVVVGRGELYLFEAPSGTLVARLPVKGATRVKCQDDIVEVSKPARRFRIDGRALTPLED